MYSQITKGLLEKYGPERVYDTPITEVWISYFICSHKSLCPCYQTLKISDSHLFFYHVLGWIYWNWSWCRLCWLKACCRIYDF